MLLNPRRSLIVRILLLVLLVQSVLLLFLGKGIQHAMRHYSQVQSSQLVEPVAAQIRMALAPALSAGDTQGVQRRVYEIHNDNPLLAYLAVSDASHRPLASAGPVPAEGDDKAATPDISDLSFPLRMADKVVGHVRLGVRLSPVYAFHQEISRSTLLISATHLLLSTLVIGLVLWYSMRRLRNLDRAARTVSTRALKQVEQQGADDEIGRLAHSFSAIIEALERQLDEQMGEKTRLRAIADYTFAWEIWLDNDGGLIWTNPSALRITGYPPEELLSMRDFPEPLLPPGPAEELAAWRRLQQEPGSSGLESSLRRKDGSLLPVAIYWQPIVDAEGSPMGKRASFIDISKRRQAESILRESLEELQVSQVRQHELLVQSEQHLARFRALLSAMNLGILFETPDHRVEYINRAFGEMWMLDPQTEPAGRPVAELLAQVGDLFAGASNTSRYMLEPENAFENSEQQELELADGRILTQISYPVRDPEHRAVGRLWLYEDVTHERHTAEQLIYLAERDSLTGLFNRHRFQVEMERMISLAQRYDHRFALLYLDLDEFKLINDTYGHREGDTVLTRIAGELAQVVRKNDIFARLGGDEFAIVTLIDRDLEEIKQLAHRIVNAVARIPFRFNNQNLRITASVGIAVYPDMSRDPESLIAQADAAMYQAKSQGKNTWSLYDKERDTSVTMMAHMNWTQRIEHGLENDLFQVYFQGIYHVSDRTLAHLEALVRLRDPDNRRKLYMPGQFVPIAEKSGKILAIDQWVLRRVIRMLAKYPQMPAVAVNISGRSFDDPSLPQRIRQWLGDSQVDPARLMIELTETAAVSDIQDAQRFIDALHQTGCTVCLDDFGSGFSSFAYLKHIAADVLKIDGQFIHDLPNNPENQIFLRALLDVAIGLKKTTVAEFVDSEAVFNMLSEFGVDLAQGYYLDKPTLNHPAIPRK